MAIDQKQIGIAVIIVIKEPQAPAAQHLRCRPNFTGLVRKDKILLVVVETEKLAIDIRHEKILPTVAIIVRRVYSHSRARFSRVAVSYTCRQSNLFKFSAPLIDK